jgi:hypothetical protein
MLPDDHAKVCGNQSLQVLSHSCPLPNRTWCHPCDVGRNNNSIIIGLLFPFYRWGMQTQNCFLPVGFNIMQVMGHVLGIMGNWILSRKISGGWRSPPQWLWVPGVPSHPLPVFFLFTAHSAGEMFFGPCLFCIFSLCTPDSASLELGYSWKGCLGE